MPESKRLHPLKNAQKRSVRNLAGEFIRKLQYLREGLLLAVFLPRHVPKTVKVSYHLSRQQYCKDYNRAASDREGSRCNSDLLTSQICDYEAKEH